MLRKMFCIFRNNSQNSTDMPLLPPIKKKKKMSSCFKWAPQILCYFFKAGYIIICCLHAEPMPLWTEGREVKRWGMKRITKSTVLQRSDTIVCDLLITLFTPKRQNKYLIFKTWIEIPMCATFWILF